MPASMTAAQKTCPRCQRKYAAKKNYCRRDGARLVLTAANTPAVAPRVTDERPDADEDFDNANH